MGRYRRRRKKNTSNWNDLIYTVIAIVVTILTFKAIAFINKFFKSIDHNYILSIIKSAVVIFLYIVLTWVIIFSIYKFIKFFKKWMRKIRKLDWIDLENIEIDSKILVDNLNEFSWREFEIIMQNVFNHNWYHAQARRWTKDWWIDIDAKKWAQHYLIQCKKYKKWKVAEKEIKEFYASIMDHDNGSNSKIKAIWIYLTTNTLTKNALYYAKAHDIEVWDKHNIYELFYYYLEINPNLKQILLSEKTKKVLIKDKIKKIENKQIKCKKCWSLMIKRIAKQWSYKWNKFLWCSNFPSCKNIVDLPK